MLFPQKPLVDGVILGGKAAKCYFTQRRWVSCEIPHFRDGDRSRQLDRITKSPGADRWKGNGPDVVLYSEFKRPAIAGGEELRLAPCAASPDRPERHE